ncbi:DUF1080 domain-containing protein [Luteolibacter pohnpeiensis]|uniref:DUF1080 domain-containing protein n=1 Tax=Luteolibacter pohnpeiensis TaxID=454153 RepID=A0A934S7I0_9BACT|nr:DUF1080 domain-containing protein [Luteolibacter pohnpeiensis]MBK1882226.1 DUF1080 domain-containing protein [Luteolibacter pohnpeiensis]
MKKLLACLLLIASPAYALEAGFKEIFNGKNLNGWTSVNGDGKYEVKDGEIVGTGDNTKANTFLRTKKTYKDFDFRFEFKFDTLEGNSGVMFRGLQRDGKDGRVYGYQCEHDQDKKRAWTAGIYDEARRGWLMPASNSDEAKKAFTAQGQELMKWDDWNEVRIVAEGKHLTIYLNGKLRSDYTDNDEKNFTPEGFFALQVHAGKACNVRWRNLRVKEL